MQRHSFEERMDTSTPSDTSLSSHHPHDTIETSDTDVDTPTLRGGRGVISGGETLPHGHHRGRTSRRGTSRREYRVCICRVMEEVVGVEVFLLEVDEGVVMV